MNINQLSVLRALIQTGSTVAAADETGLSQSGVSRIIKQLESDLGLELFARRQGRLVPTPEAAILAEDAQEVFLAMERLSGRAKDLRSGITGQEFIRIAFPVSLWEHFAPAILEEFTAEFPDVRVETYFETAATIVRMFEHRQIDLGFMRFEPTLAANVAFELVAEGENVCVIPAGHPLCDHKVITPADLHGVPLIMTGRQRPQRVALDHMFEKAGFRPLIKIETHTNSSACAFVARGLGVSIISSLFANLFRDFPIVLRPFRPRSTQSFGLLQDKDVPLPLAARRISEILKREFIRSQLPLDELLSNGR